MREAEGTGHGAVLLARPVSCSGRLFASSFIRGGHPLCGRNPRANFAPNFAPNFTGVTRVKFAKFPAAPAGQRGVANQIVCLGPLPLLRAATRISSTVKPFFSSRRVKAGSGPADQTARTPPGRSAVRAARRPEAV